MLILIIVVILCLIILLFHCVFKIYANNSIDKKIYRNISKEPFTGKYKYIPVKYFN